MDPRWGRVIHQTLPSLAFLAPPIQEGSGNQTKLSLPRDNKGRSRTISREESYVQTTRLLAAHLCGYYSRAAYIRAIQRRLLDACSSTRNLSALLSAMEKSCTTRTALALVRRPLSELFAYVCVRHVLLQVIFERGV